jgi:hypothetical protein
LWIGYLDLPQRVRWRAWLNALNPLARLQSGWERK